MAPAIDIMRGEVTSVMQISGWTDGNTKMPVVEDPDEPPAPSAKPRFNAWGAWDDDDFHDYPKYDIQW